MRLLSSNEEKKKEAKKIMDEVVAIDRKKSEIVAKLIPLMKDFYEEWHTESVLEKRLYELFSKPQKNKIIEEEEVIYSRDTKDLEKEVKDLKEIKILINHIEELNNRLNRKLSLLNSYK